MRTEDSVVKFEGAILILAMLRWNGCQRDTHLRLAVSCISMAEMGHANHAISIQLKQCQSGVSDRSELFTSSVTLLTLLPDVLRLIMLVVVFPASGFLEAAPTGPSSSLGRIQKV